MCAVDELIVDSFVAYYSMPSIIPLAPFANVSKLVLNDAQTLQCEDVIKSDWGKNLEVLIITFINLVPTFSRSSSIWSFIKNYEKYNRGKVFIRPRNHLGYKVESEPQYFLSNLPCFESENRFLFDNEHVKNMLPFFENSTVFRISFSLLSENLKLVPPTLDFKSILLAHSNSTHKLIQTVSESHKIVKIQLTNFTRSSEIVRIFQDTKISETTKEVEFFFEKQSSFPSFQEDLEFQESALILLRSLRYIHKATISFHHMTKTLVSKQTFDSLFGKAIFQNQEKIDTLEIVGLRDPSIAAFLFSDLTIKIKVRELRFITDRGKVQKQEIIDILTELTLLIDFSHFSISINLDAMKRSVKNLFKTRGMDVVLTHFTR
ncbi:hypothetical protein HK096_005171 [Nowakowskiella sp. JEL0078]|nr:hypothetical protein HK096_005171 [Nowakowskiella sp. JEL0078]